MSATAQFQSESNGDGAFVRQQSDFRDWVTADGSSGYPAEPGRYHLYVSLACPWAHRAIIVRELKGLQDAIAMTIVDPERDERGWRFEESRSDPLHGWTYLSEAYAATNPAFTGRVSVPVLWDTETGGIVNNESADVIVMLNEAFDEFAVNPGLDLYPEAEREQIDVLNKRVYEAVNNGVYATGFATTQAAYERSVYPLFSMLDELESRLGASRFLMGDHMTLADWRLFTTLVRFDAVYHGHFKCNIRKISEYRSLFGYLCDLFQQPGIAQTVDFDHIKRHYYVTHQSINPTGIVPVGPHQDLGAPHGRARLGA